MVCRWERELKGILLSIVIFDGKAEKDNMMSRIFAIILMMRVMHFYLYT